MGVRLQSRGRDVVFLGFGSQVMRRGATRDRLRKELDVLYFEMEAAGLMDGFPCLMIRGICDYTDSQKKTLAYHST
jgi:nucleoside phosphorylase